MRQAVQVAQPDYMKVANQVLVGRSAELSSALATRLTQDQQRS